MRTSCWYALWPLALGACSVSSSDMTTPPGSSAGGAIQPESSTDGGGRVGGGGGSGGIATGPDAATGGKSSAGGGVATDGSVADGSSTGIEASMDAGADETNPLEGGGGPCAGLFCEDFEHGQIDPAKWDVKMGAGGMQMVQQQTVAHGRYAWHVHGTGARGDFATILTKNTPMPLQGAGPVFGRAYVYATANVGAHIQLGFAGTTRNPMVAPTLTPTEGGINFNYMEFAEFSNSWQLGFDLFAPAPSVAKGFVEEASYPPAKDSVPVTKWSCIEWEFNDNPDMMVMWVDGKQLDQFDVQHIDFSSTTRTPGSVLNGNNSDIIGGFAFFGFGFHSWGASAAVDRYYDDIVLDVKRVNCLQ